MKRNFEGGGGTRKCRPQVMLISAATTGPGTLAENARPVKQEHRQRWETNQCPGKQLELLPGEGILHLADGTSHKVNVQIVTGTSGSLAPIKACIPVVWHQLEVLAIADPAAVNFRCVRCRKLFVGVLPPGQAGLDPSAAPKVGTVFFRPLAYEGIDHEADLVCIETPIPAEGSISATWRKSESRFQIPCFSAREGLRLDKFTCQ